MDIRRTTIADAPGLQALVAAVARERAFLGSTEGFTLDQTRAWIERLHAVDGVGLLAFPGDENGDARPVGWVDVTPGPFEGLTHCGRLGMGVAARARGRGIGRALLARALDEGFARLDRIELEVFASNDRARALYRRAGFVDEGCRRCARKLDGACDDILMMGLLRSEWAAARL